MRDAIAEPLSRLRKSLKTKLLGQILDTLQCPVCKETMTVPFLLPSCGHSFCYTCLKTWLANNPTCPMCRAQVQSKPVLDIKLKKILEYIIDAIITGDSGRKEAIDKFVKEKDEDYEKDCESNTTPFDRIFMKFSVAVIDTSDGVPRCSVCHWEVHGNICENCGRRLIQPSYEPWPYDDDESLNNPSDESYAGPVLRLEAVADIQNDIIDDDDDDEQYSFVDANSSENVDSDGNPTSDPDWRPRMHASEYFMDEPLHEQSSGNEEQGEPIDNEEGEPLNITTPRYNRGTVINSTDSEDDFPRNRQRRAMHNHRQMLRTMYLG